MSTIEFKHQQTAHCESGAISALLRHYGLEMSEPMAFGIAGALTFAYLPLLKLGGLPLIAYRMPPGHIIRSVTKRLGIGLHYERFRQSEAGMQALDAHLDAGRPVGLQTSVYWLPYFPKEMRFHFNAHNVIAYGREGDQYLISDPSFEAVVTTDHKSLKRARFVKGMLAPKGLLYYPNKLPSQINFDKVIRGAIKMNCRMMLYSPVPIAGLYGIKFLTKKIRKLGKNHDKQENDNKQFLGHIVRMQEEIGTGGAGFRFLYASFLQEAAEMINRPQLNQVSESFTETGDQWRHFALYAAKMCKNRMAMDYDKLADQLQHCGTMEKAAYRQLLQAIR